MEGPSTVQILIVLLILCIFSGMFGWCIRDAKGSKVRRFKVKRKLRPKPYRFKKLPARYNWQV